MFIWAKCIYDDTHALTDRSEKESLAVVFDVVFAVVVVFTRPNASTITLTGRNKNQYLRVHNVRCEYLVVLNVFFCYC